MTDIIDTGEIPRGALDQTARIYRTDQTATLPLPEETARLRLGEGPIFDLRPARPASLGELHRYLDDRPYPPVPKPTPPQPKTLADDLLGDFTPITRPEPPPVPSSPPAPKPAWARSGSAGEWPIVVPEEAWRRPPQHRRRAPAWCRWAIAVGSLLAVVGVVPFVTWVVFW